MSYSILRSTFKTKYLSSIESMNKNSAIIYRDHLKPFESFAMNTYNIDLDCLVINIQKCKYNVYDILSEFSSYLQNHNYNKPLSSTTLRNRIKVVKNFLEFNDVHISDNKFKQRRIHKDKTRPICISNFRDDPTAKNMVGLSVSLSQ